VILEELDRLEGSAEQFDYLRQLYITRYPSPTCAMSGWKEFETYDKGQEKVTSLVKYNFTHYLYSTVGYINRMHYTTR
jgi:hypothetical protein